MNEIPCKIYALSLRVISRERQKKEYLIDVGDEFRQSGTDQLLLEFRHVAQRQNLGNTVRLTNP